ncbi:hypothetical protein GCM10022409_25830 [Hymenobacter glaciei]|uniref:LamG-like jellyroll fold domain-containing protein n=1 Tax=Hymenobacter glaciei TaxID=877209 RepID=A0ABP7UAJ2_9BACT
MKHIFSSNYWRKLGRGSRWAALLLAAPLAASAANPVLRIQGLGSLSGNGDVTAFVDQVEIVRVSDGMVMAGAVANPGFETNGLAAGQSSYNTPGGAPWTFNNRSGISRNGSGFGSTAPQGDAVAFLQSQGGINGLVDQGLMLADGLYQVRFLTAQRTNCCGGTIDQRLNVLINGTSVGTIQPPSSVSYATFTSNAFVVGSPNNALAFDGVDDYVALPSTTPVPVSNSNYTIEAWIKPTAMGDYGIIGWGNYGTTNQVNALRLYSGGLINYWWGNDAIIPTANLSGRWHHVAATFDGTTRRIYLDGVQAGSDTPGAGHAVPNANNLRIGSTNPPPSGLGEYFPGSIDEVRVYNTGLTAAQVQADMFSTNPAVPGNQVAYYDFNQGTAGGSNGGRTTLNDGSGFNNNGTLTNFTLLGTTSNFVRSFPTITQVSPVSGPRGSSVLIAGTNLKDATSFAFNGTAVSPFTTPTDDFSTSVTVPATATTGPVSTASATLTTFTGPVFTVNGTDLVVSTGTQTSPTPIPAGSYNSITVTNTGNGVLSGNVSVDAFLTVQPGGGLSDGCALISGAGSFTLGAGSILGICNAAGISSSGATGSVQVTGTRSFSTAAQYGYTGAAAVTGNGLPSTVASLAINTAGNVTLSAPVAVTAAVGVGGAGNLVLNGQALTLLSNASGTALARNSSTGVVVGNATVQRYIDPSLNPGLGYRHYSAPVSNSTVADLATAGFSPEISQAATYNSSATPGTTTPFPTVFGYDQSRVTLANAYAPFDRGYVVPVALTTPLAVGSGYAVNLPASALVDFVGTLTNGDQAPLALSRVAGNTDAGWQLLGNPYPAPLDYSLVAPADRLNLDGAIYVYSSTSQYGGQYRSYVNGIGGNPVLPVAQGFFVRVSSGQTSGSLTFRNSQRLTTANATTFQRTTTDTRPLVHLDLRGATGSADALYAYAETGATPAFDSQFDAEKIANSTGLNLSSNATSGQRLAIDGRPVFDAATVLALNVGVPAAGTYTLAAIALNNLPVGLDAYLRDAQTGQTVNLRTQPSYAFTVTAAQATALLVGRFSLQFSASALATAPALTAAQVALYPNPARARFSVLMPGVAGATSVQAELVNALGQVVRRQAAALPVSGATLTVETSELAAGVYTLRLQAGNTALAKRVVLQ